MKKFTVSRDDSIYQAWPDLALTPSGKLVCVFSECTHHHDRSYTRIMLCDSDDRGRNWSPKRPLTLPSQSPDPFWFWNCARISILRDGRLAVLVDRVSDESSSGEGANSNYLFFSSDEGRTWTEPILTPAQGIVPDRTFLLDCPVEVGLHRALKRNRQGPQEGQDRFEREAKAFHQKVRAAYLALAEVHHERFVVIDSSRGADDTERAIFDHVIPYMDPA